MNTRRLSMLSLMLNAAAGWTPGVLGCGANAAAPQSLAAIPLEVRHLGPWTVLAEWPTTGPMPAGRPLSRASRVCRRRPA